MPELKPETKKKLIEYFFAQIEINSRGLTDWEEKFIESIKEQWISKGTLTISQYEHLEKIYAERTG